MALRDKRSAVSFGFIWISWLDRTPHLGCLDQQFDKCACELSLFVAGHLRHRVLQKRKTELRVASLRLLLHALPSFGTSCEDLSHGAAARSVASKSRSSVSAAAETIGAPNVNFVHSGLNIHAGRQQMVSSGS